MADINDLDSLERFFELLLGEGVDGQSANELTKAIVQALNEGRAEVKPNQAFKLRPEDDAAKKSIIDSLIRTQPARRRGNPPSLTKEQI